MDDFLDKTGASIHYGGQRAFFRPSTDEIVLPSKARFSHASDFYATALHELTHWSGHQSRLNREGGCVFGDKAYAFEELVAELGCAFLMAELGVEGDVQHESYIASWVEAMKEDKRVIFKAATLASQAHQYLMSLEEGQLSEVA